MNENIVKKLVYFSPTRTIKTVVEGVAREFKAVTVERIDLIKPIARLKPLQTGENEFLIVGIPVYMGRVPKLFY